MRDDCAVILAVALAVLGTPCGTFAAPPPGQTGEVQGITKDAAQQNLSGVRVQVRGATGQLAATGTTNAAGQFSFTGLAPGAHNIEVLGPTGNVVGTSTVKIVPGATATVTINAAAGGALASGKRGGLRLSDLGTIGTVSVIQGAAALTTATVVAMKDGKITICHKFGNNNSQTLDVKPTSLESHMLHGDTLGACPASPSR